ncbi:imelysin family protein [Rhodovulum sp. DZ06]|uniref:imelysin family protein n=1 Tax=Rhodovulum sp. DZ06 TaxID=3425126 RepID=UPI003D34EA16
MYANARRPAAALAALMLLAGAPAFAAADAPAPAPAAVQQRQEARDAAIRAAVDRHALPGFARFAEAAAALDAAARADCAPDAPALRAAWGAAFDAWLAVSHLRFGPTEAGHRAFALAFWPDAKGFTPRTLGKLLKAPEGADPLADPAAFAESSIAGRGFYAMERLMFDKDVSAAPPERACALVRAQAADIARIAAELDAAWRATRGPMLIAHDGGDYPAAEDAARELYKALDAGLQFIADVRLGRPLGTLDRPRPMRAEAHRSGRAQHNVEAALAALDELHAALSGPLGGAPRTASAFARARKAAAELNDPSFAKVTEPMGRFRLEALQTAVEDARAAAAEEIGKGLGVSAGFNALDGD